MKNLLTAFITLWVCFTVNADDIEIYQGQSTGVRQNVMFLMDTSRSMSRWEYFNVGPYDSTKTYAKPINGFEPETYYYSALTNGDGNSETEAQILHKRFLNKEALECPSAKAIIESEGRVVSWKFKRWNPEAKDWQFPLAALTGPQGTLDTNYTWVCREEEGNHPGGKYIDTDMLFSSGKYRGSKSIGYNIRWSDHVGNIFKGNYLNYQIYERGNNEDSSGDATADDRRSRMSLVREAANEAATVVNGFKLGLSRFDVNSDGGFIDLPIDNIENVRESFKTKLDSYFTFGATPLSESYYEIAKYYRGEAVDFGKDSQSRIQRAGRVINRFPSGTISYLSGILPINTYVADTFSVPESRVNNTYISPISSSCQSVSSIVLFTDGEPSNDAQANDKIKALLNSEPELTFPEGSGLSLNCSGNGACADELAYYLANYDQRKDLPGKQVIRTYVIGGFIEDTSGESYDPGENIDSDFNNNLNGIPLLQSIAYHGGTQYYPADNYQTVVDAIAEAFSSASSEPATFVAPTISTNSYNSLEHQDELYYAMFSPNNRANWQGNLKLYTLSPDGQVLDANKKPAIRSDGTFDKLARSYWTPPGDEHADGGNVGIGGAAQHLTKEHNIFTHLTTARGTLSTTVTNTPEIRNLMQIPSNMSADDFARTVDWANRVDTNNAIDGNRKEIEDSLHSRPVVINYSAELDPTTGKVSSDSVVYMATNSGYLHAFKADKEDYQEYFSYIPKELLPNVAQYANEAPLRKDQLYGLDGHISYWFKDANKNGIVEKDAGDQVILYVGMRRGGNHYYALDVTDRNSPKYLWQIDGGSADFARLGQSWSEMTLTKVLYDDEEKVVLLFGGGYDPTEDAAVSASSNQLGNAIYMIDAQSGELLWKASKSSHDLNDSEMTASFMNNIRIVDFNGDRITDYFFASDVAGRIWRFDIDKANTGAADFADGGIIFDANGDSSDSTYNRFYNSPSISYFKEKLGAGFLTISIGTGFRASPLSASSEDAFYVLKDYNVSNKPASYIKRTPSELAHYSLADDTITNSDEAMQKKGWKFALSGLSEKVLADALTTHGRVIFTTFAPNPTPNPGTCSYDLGKAKAYTINFQGGIDGMPTIDIPSCEATGTCPEPPPLVPPVIVETSPETVEKPINCEDSGTCPPPSSCDDGGTVVLIGTSKLGETISRCGILEKDYWLER